MQESINRVLPDISFTIKHGDDEQTGDFSLECVGFGIHQCWIYATMFGATALFNHQNMFDGAFEAQFTLQFLISIIFLAVMLLFYAINDDRLRDKIPPRASVVTGAIITSVGSLLLLIPGLPYDVATSLEVISGVLTGIGSATLIISWGVRFSRRDLFSIAVNSIVAIAFAYFLYSFILASLPSPAGGIISSVLPLLELPILLNPPQKDFFTDSYSKHFKPLPVRTGKFLLSFGVPMLIFGLAMGLLRHLCIQHAAELSSQSSVVAITFAIVILFGRVVLFPSREGSWALDFRGLVPLIAVAIAFIPTAVSTNAEAASTLILITYLCFETLMWTYFGEISQAFRISPLLVFGLGRGLVAIGTLISSGLIVEMRYGIASFSGEEGLILFLILTLVVAFTLLPNKHSFRSIVAIDRSKNEEEEAKIAYDFDKPDDYGLGSNGEKAPAKNEDAFEHDTTLTSQERKTTPEVQTTKAAPAAVATVTTVSTVAATAPAQSSQVPAQQAQAIRQGTIAATTTRAVAQPIRTTAGVHKTPGINATRTPTAHTYTAAMPITHSEARRAMEAGSAASAPSAQAPSHVSVAAEEPPRQRKGWFRKKCEAVSNTYMLSAREEEVLFYLAKGFNAGHIQEKLYISEGTAKTHMRHIYRKLDVHSQQALIRLVEGTEIEEDF